MASSYASLETILDNVGGAVYVQDLTTGSVLFLNRSMKHTFEKELKEGTIQDWLEREISADSGVSEINLPGRTPAMVNCFRMIASRSCLTGRLV